MKKRFVPSHYYKEVHQKLHRLTLDSKSVKDYHNEIEMLVIKANIEEDMVVTMARFIGGLNKEIVDLVELHHYVEIEDLVSIAIEVKKQQNQRRVTKAFSNSNSKWGSKWSKHEDTKKNKGSNPKEKGLDITKKKGTSNSPSFTTTSRHRDIKCFKCQDLSHYASDCSNNDNDENDG